MRTDILFVLIATIKIVVTITMLLKTRHIFRFNRPAFHFSPKGKPPKHKVQTVGFVNDHIENVK